MEWQNSIFRADRVSELLRQIDGKAQAGLNVSNDESARHFLNEIKKLIANKREILND